MSKENYDKKEEVLEWRRFMIVVGIIIVVIIVGIFLRPRDKDGQDFSDNLEVNVSGDLMVEDIEVGTGDEVGLGQVAVVDYTGTLTNGVKFDSSIDRGEPFRFTVGSGEVIQGWDIGVVGMKVGGRRLLTIPPRLGYGDRNVGSIPANSSLIFEILLVGVE
jgi:FKBP-type peptidyl-prolyl cis-trans isomerase